MRLYENAFPSTYEEIKTWYPVWYREVFEMDSMWRVFGNAMDRIQAELVLMVENNFIDSADAQTVTRLENFLGIVHPFPRTLVERRAVLRGFVRGRGHMGRPQIIEIISIFTSGIIDVEFNRPGRINITVTRDFGDMFNLFDINLILGHRIPAHLSMFIIDRPQPVKVVNENRFIFIDLLMMHFRFANITAPRIRLDGERLLDGTWLLGSGAVHGINFIDFHVRAIVRNYGIIAENLLLDGSNLLDGSFFLNGRKFAPLRGISAQHLDMGVFKITNPNKLLAGIFVRYRILNITAPRYMLDGKNNLDGSWLLDSKVHGIKFVDFRVGVSVAHKQTLANRRLSAGVYTLQNSNSLGRGTLTRARPWNLDGSLALDAGLSAGGTQTLEKLIVEEVL